MLALTPTYLPQHRRGAEVTLHAVLRSLQRRGHQIRVLTSTDAPSEVDDVPVVPSPSGSARSEHARWADVIVGQLSARWEMLELAARAGRPSVYFVHVGNVPQRSLYGAPDLTVFNSELLRSEYSWVQPALVVHPPVFEHEYRTSSGNAYTLINLIPAKGSDIFFELARRLPARSFLGVRGAVSQPIPEPLPPNVTILDPTADMRDVYGRTRVLLAPSVYESYGRTALEAAASGIPTVAAPTPGMREAMGDAAIWVSRNDLDGWVQRLRSLDDPARYTAASAAARARFDAFDPDSELDRLEAALRDLVEPTERHDGR